ncbi:Sugar-specific transcriptional regulator TrmB [Halovivax ruber XH-70]|uniref:Sugar-specific transcriptional regulator TrmB n=1 Tax=Halovivax ruber (strain DSM 18193 / JCM 13892 / XH-70) TaxID=797302 RepID=L0IAC2_HALRX|nr:winged helix-turn-helix domain-containing protein [Halovivax ruber]AGB14882.1 Sugar-specific transcriptional regulator TrmB [Halovivax ruber XH-70]
MTGFDPVQPGDDGEPDRSRWQGDRDTFDRVYDTLLGITEPTAATEIAEIAGCSPNAAKKHLDRLAEMGVATAASTSRPTTYERNEGYLEWQTATRIAQELSVADIVDRVERLEDERDAYEVRFGATDPAAVSAFDSDDHGDVHDRMAAIADWHATIRDIRQYELARQIAQNDGRLLPA